MINGKINAIRTASFPNRFFPGINPYYCRGTERSPGSAPEACKDRFYARLRRNISIAVIPAKAGGASQQPKAGHPTSPSLVGKLDPAFAHCCPEKNSCDTVDALNQKV
jgi:hypothetical protein